MNELQESVSWKQMHVSVVPSNVWEEGLGGEAGRREKERKH